MKDEAKKAIDLEDLDKVTGGTDPNLEFFMSCGWNGKCPSCGRGNFENEQFKGYVCQYCGAIYTSGELKRFLLSQGIQLI